MADETDRPQDVGRRHRRKGAPSAATAALLTRYQAAMRDELTSLLDELRPKTDPQVLLDGSTAPAKRPALAERSRIWDLAMRLGRELGAEIDPPAPVSFDQETGAAPTRRAARRGRIDYGGA